MADNVFDAENGVDGSAVTSTLESRVSTTSGAGCTFSAAAKASEGGGSLGYRTNAASGVQNLCRFTLSTAALVFSSRFSFCPRTPPTTLRSAWAFRHAGGYVNRWRHLASSGKLRLSFLDSAAANEVIITELFTVDTWYDLSIVHQVNSSAGINKYFINFYDLNGTTPLNATPYISTTYALGTANISHFDWGYNDTVAAAGMYDLDNMKFTDAKTTEQAPFYTAPAASFKEKVLTAEGWR